MKIGPLKLSSIRTRLTLWNVGVLALVLVVLGTILCYTAKANLMASVDRDLAVKAIHPLPWWPPSWWARILAENPNYPSPAGAGNGVPLSFGSGPANRAMPIPPTGPRREGPNARFRMRLLTLQGKVLYPTVGDTNWDTGDAFALAAKGGQSYTTVTIDNEPMRVLTTPLRHSHRVVGVTQVAYSLADLNRSMEGLTRTLLMLIPLALLIAGGGGAFLTDRMLRPVRSINQSAARIGAEDFSQRLPEVGGDEFSELASTFNGVLGRLQESFTRMEQAFEQQRRFTADASHELRTPLTVIKANTSLALAGEPTPAEYQEALEAADRAANLMNRIVQDLLLLAHSDTGQLVLDLRPVSIREVLKMAVESLQGREHAPIKIDQPDLSLAVCADSSHLVRLFTNLLDNAARHTSLGGRITLAVAADKTNVTIAVQDTGIGIPPEHLPHICERFYRVDAARSRKQGGVGLGLAISKSIVEAHHGTFTIKSVYGQGTTVHIILPRTDAIPWQETELPRHFMPQKVPNS